MRILAYCIMPNHWHLVLYPRNDRDLSEFMRWVTTTHVRQRRTRTKSVGQGHLYQGAYKSFLVQDDTYLIDLIRYVEQNPLRAKLVDNAQDWEWSSLYQRVNQTSLNRRLLDSLPTILPSNYLESVNDILSASQLRTLRTSVNKCVPYGDASWVDRKVQEYNLQGVLRPPGRPTFNITPQEIVIKRTPPHFPKERSATTPPLRPSLTPSPKATSSSSRSQCMAPRSLPVTSPTTRATPTPRSMKRSI